MMKLKTARYLLCLVLGMMFVAVIWGFLFIGFELLLWLEKGNHGWLGFGIVFGFIGAWFGRLIYMALYGDGKL